MKNLQSYPKKKIEVDVHQYGKVTVTAYQVSEQFAIHRTIENRYSQRGAPMGWQESAKFWTITHIPTGRCLFEYLHKGKNALDVITEIENRWDIVQLLDGQVDREKHEGFTEFYFRVKKRITFGY